MGLAASQARFLGLTARKSNVEYQGQQINQQRTALSNEIMGLYNEYDRLEVPTPPSVQDYQNTVYTIDDTPENYQISNFSKILEGENAGQYNVTLTYSEEVPKAYTYTPSLTSLNAVSGTNGFSKLNITIGTEKFVYEEDADGNVSNESTITKITSDYDKYPGLSTIMKANNATDGIYYQFVRGNTVYYASQSEIETTFLNQGIAPNAEGEYKYSGGYAFDYQGTIKTPKTVQAVAAIGQEADGRLSSIQVISCDDSDLVGYAYSVSAKTSDDQNAYTDATNKYNYEKQVYENEIARINAKTKKIQEQDRHLELQLKQLDTEQTALKTEMESISKVIEETVDAVFKTFSS